VIKPRASSRDVGYVEHDANRSASARQRAGRAAPAYGNHSVTAGKWAAPNGCQYVAADARFFSSQSRAYASGARRSVDSSASWTVFSKTQQLGRKPAP
jgi:hypothetical protein